MNNCRSSNALKLQEIIHTFSLKQMVTDITHEGDSPSLIDSVLISDKIDSTDCTVIPPLSNADHNGISMTISKKQEIRVSKPCNRLVWCMEKANFEKACDLIDATDWGKILKNDNVNVSTVNWTSKFMEIMEECIPRRQVCKRNQAPWLTKAITQQIR